MTLSSSVSSASHGGAAAASTASVMRVSALPPTSRSRNSLSTEWSNPGSSSSKPKSYFRSIRALAARGGLALGQALGKRQDRHQGENRRRQGRSTPLREQVGEVLVTARVVLRATIEAARKNGADQYTKKEPRPVTTVRRNGCGSVGRRRPAWSRPASSRSPTRHRARSCRTVRRSPIEAVRAQRRRQAAAAEDPALRRARADSACGRSSAQGYGTNEAPRLKA